MENQRQPMLSDKRPFSMLIYSSILVLVIGLAFQLLGLLLATLLYNIPASDLLDFSAQMDQKAINALKLLQIIGALGTFVFSSFIISYFYTRSFTAFFLFGKNINGKAVILLVIIMLAVLPFINLVSELNLKFHFPFEKIESYFRNMEEEAESLMMTLLRADNFGALLVNLFMIAIIPAIGEELVFRGLIQKHLTGLFKNPHIAILIASLVFSLAHFQIYSSIPRLLLGMIMGYFYYYGRSLWYPMIAHLINNSLGVIFYYQMSKDQLGDSSGVETLEDIGSMQMMPITALISVVLSVSLMYAWIKTANTTNPSARSGQV